MQEDALLAYQIGFDLVENELQSFLTNVQAHLDARTSAATAAATATGPSADDAMETDQAPPAAGEDSQLSTRMQKMQDILSGKTPIGMHLEFLYRNNKADLQVSSGSKLRDSVTSKPACAARDTLRMVALLLRVCLSAYISHAAFVSSS